MLRVGEFMRNHEVFSVQLASNEVPGVDFRKYNCPMCTDLAAILLDDNMGSNKILICTSEVGDYSKKR